MIGLHSDAEKSLYASLSHLFHRKFKNEAQDPFEFKSVFEPKLRKNLGEEACNLILVKVKRNDGMTWLSNQIADLVSSCVSVPKKKCYHSLILNDNRFSLLVDLVGEFRFKLKSDFYLKTNFIIPKRIGFFVSSLIFNVLAVLGRTPLPIVLLILAAILIVGYFFRGDESNEYQKIFNSISDPGEKKQINRLVSSLSSDMIKGTFPRVIIVDNFANADSLTKATVRKYFTKYKRKTVGWETWVLLEYDYNAPMYESLLNFRAKFNDNNFNLSFFETQYFDIKVRNRLIAEYNLISGGGKIPIESNKYPSIKNLVGSVGIDPEERFSFESTISNLDFNLLKLCFLLSGNTYSTNTPIDASGLSSTIYPPPNKSDDLSILLKIIWPEFKNHYPRSKNLNNDLDRLKANFSSYLIDKERLLFSPKLYDLLRDYNLTHKLFEEEEIQLFHSVYWGLKNKGKLILETSWSIKLYEHLRKALDDPELLAAHGAIKSYSKELIFKLLESLRNTPQGNSVIPFDLIQKAIPFLKDVQNDLIRLREFSWEFYLIHHDTAYINQINHIGAILPDSPRAIHLDNDNQELKYFYLRNMIDHIQEIDVKEYQKLEPLILSMFSSFVRLNKPNSFTSLQCFSLEYEKEILANIIRNQFVANEFSILNCAYSIWASTNLLTKRILENDSYPDNWKYLFESHLNALVQLKNEVSNYDFEGADYHGHFAWHIGHLMYKASGLVLTHTLKSSGILDEKEYRTKLSVLFEIEGGSSIDTDYIMLEGEFKNIITLWNSFGFATQANIFRIMYVEYLSHMEVESDIDLYRQHQFKLSFLSLHKQKHPICLWSHAVLAKLSSSITELQLNHRMEICNFVNENYQKRKFFYHETIVEFVVDNSFVSRANYLKSNTLNVFSKEFSFNIKSNPKQTKLIKDSLIRIGYRLIFDILNNDEDFKTNLNKIASSYLNQEEQKEIEQSLLNVKVFNDAHRKHTTQELISLLNEPSNHTREKMEASISYINRKNEDDPIPFELIEKTILTQELDLTTDNLGFRFFNTLLSHNFKPTTNDANRIIEAYKSNDQDLTVEEAIKFYTTLIAHDVDDKKYVSERLTFWNEVNQWIKDQRMTNKNLRRIHESEYLELLCKLFSEIPNFTQISISVNFEDFNIKDHYSQEELKNEFAPILNDKFNLKFYKLSSKLMPLPQPTDSQKEQLEYLNELAKANIIAVLELMIEHASLEFKSIYKTYSESLTKILDPETKKYMEIV
ncbi:MAG: hypothetical protein ABJF11_00315 [Reichenbachiella sp.]|uniref:hypothetical protein n=1 Tax=Reichenbachiella sp. TaxID=2184521 RepID=UPI0032675390